MKIHEKRINDFIFTLRDHKAANFSEVEFLNYLIDFKLLLKDQMKAKESMYWQKFYSKFALNEA